MQMEGKWYEGVLINTSVHVAEVGWGELLWQLGSSYVCYVISMQDFFRKCV